MISHVFIGITDFPRALAFYALVLDSLGLVLKFNDPDKPWAGWVAPNAARLLLLIGTPLIASWPRRAMGRCWHYYGAYFRDADGNTIGICCHDPV